MLHARCGDDDADIDAGVVRGRAGLVDDDLQGRGDATNVGRVAGRVGLDFHAHGPFGGVVLGGLADEAAHCGFGAHEVARGVVGTLETEPPAPVGWHGCGIDVQQVRGQAHTLGARHVDHGGGAHGSREVQVQVSFGQGYEISPARRRGARCRQVGDSGCVHGLVLPEPDDDVAD